MTSAHESEYGYDRLTQRSTKAQTTLGDLHPVTPWVWVNCEKCLHHAPLACAVPVIRWSADVSSDKRNTSRAGSNMPCSRIQRRRARATSARSCSAARRHGADQDCQKFSRHVASARALKRKLLPVVRLEPCIRRPVAAPILQDSALSRASRRTRA